jgi:hypothetical protein
MIKPRQFARYFVPRRLVAVMAACAFAWAALFAVIGHSLAMPMMSAATAEMHDHAATDHAAVDHTGHDDVAAADPAPPCENGCSLCKDCSLCVFIAMPAAGAIPAPLQYRDYRSMPVALTDGVTPSLPTEPPRV